MAMEIYSKISAILADAEAIAKDRQNVQQGFKYRGIDDVYNALHPLLAKHKVFSTTEVLEERTEERETKSHSALIYRILKVRFTFYTTDGSSVQCVMIGEGMDSGDKASNKAMAVAHKYALFQLLAIPTEDEKDPDAQSHSVVPKKADKGVDAFPDNVPWGDEEIEQKRKEKEEQDKLNTRAKQLCDDLGKSKEVRIGLWKSCDGDIKKVIEELEAEKAAKAAAKAVEASI